MTLRIEVPAQRVPGVGERCLIEGEGKSVALFNVGGRLLAIEDSCPHQGSSLCTGKLEGAVIQCMAHGLRFDLTSGYLLNSKALKVANYPVEVEGDRVFIVLAEEEALS
ncbi:Rieske (2Fe-2S) protein [Pseudomonas plecoglossicida]|uniref:(2Fe-2S)-binding protein n=1 Tax=Pseudomonas plecoglossicida TaxID=70775 RepID=A0AAD0QTT7_PSEDL|nr:Rieske 2Fe-2S domain-containing protein [Pseudomonas plecoglossicida]AXM94506.1 (2Fe-2S)-binding protein [Pseudomonas plecoglossicida]EPB93914.1 Rieske (2Fe-2S) domain-containing protein [Pseudomonas plecoglossicida NB2011]QLB55240.1 Rieske 2Fe-2S domain-containing protein [Pseudomonas plecoglossicida]GLR35120.1 (2Fe-2S)-binding protein [Pseudomonas plecoglossicida]